MQSLHLRTKALLLAFAFAILIIGASIYFYLALQRSTEEVIATHRIMTEAAVHELSRSAATLLDSLESVHLFERDSLTKAEERILEDAFSAVAERELLPFEGMEGGFYFAHIDQFVGYAFPTSPPPKPAFGPPPRSYRIIHEQIQRTMAEQQRIVELHQFDPATFPLVTEPVVAQGKPIGAVWARVHIERLLPTVRLTSVLLVSAMISLAGFVTVIAIAWRLRQRTEEIRIGLDKLHRDPTYRFPDRGGVFGNIMRSINDMVSARAADQQLREQLERELHQQDKMATLGKLISRVAHEVKTPLAVIKTRIQMWQRKLRRDGDARRPATVVSPEAMSLVVHEVDRLSDLVKRLLAFSKPVVSSLSPTNLQSVLQQTLSSLQLHIEQRQITVTTSYASQCPPVPIDAKAIEQVFTNVCMNALEAMPDNGTLEVSIATDASRDHAIVTIRDNGPGIPREHLTRVFEPFYTTKEHGAGLGLSISYEIIRAHGGKIEFDTVNGTGTECRITLPLSSAPIPARP